MPESLKIVGATDFAFPSIPSTTTIIVGYWQKNEETAESGDYYRCNKRTLTLTYSTGSALWIVGNATKSGAAYLYNDNAMVAEDGLGASRYVGDLAFFNTAGYTEPEIEGWVYHVHMYHYNAGAGEITYGSWTRLPTDTVVREEAYAVWTLQELRDFADGIANAHPTSTGVSGENTTAQCDDMVFNGTITAVKPIFDETLPFVLGVPEDITNYYKNLVVFTSSTKPTDSQILAWSEATVSNVPAGCWGFYPLVNGAAITPNDFSGNARHLTDSSGGTESVASIEPDPIITSLTSCTITDAGDENHAANATGIVLTGVYFEAAQGAGKVEIGSTSVYASALKKQLTVTSWADLSITVNIGLGVEDGFTLGTLYLYVTNDSAEVSPAYPVVIYPVFDYYRRSMIDSLISAGAEAHGWNVEKANIPVTALVRTDANTATLTIPALGAYVITANDVISAPTIPGEVLTSGDDLITSNGFTITNDAGAIEGVIAESISISSTQTATVIKAAVIAETISLSDSQTAAATNSAARAEAMTLAHAQTATKSAVSTRAEAMTLAHAQTAAATNSAARAEAMTLAHAQDATNSKGASTNETINITETQNAQSQVTAQISEAITIAESSTATSEVNAVSAEALSIVEDQDASVSVLITGEITESISIIEAQDAISSVNASGAEELTISEEQNATKATSALVSEELTIAEEQTSTLGNLALVSEELTISEEQTASSDVQATRAEALNIVEASNAEKFILEQASATESLSISSQQIAQSQVTASRAEEVTITNSQTAGKSVSATRAEALSVTNEQTGVIVTPAVRQDNISITHEQTASKTVSALVSEALTIVSEQTSSYLASVFAEDSLVITSLEYFVDYFLGVVHKLGMFDRTKSRQANKVSRQLISKTKVRGLKRRK